MAPRARLSLAAAALLGLAGCAQPGRKAPRNHHAAAKHSAPRVDAEGQKRAYDQGVAQFGEERYAEARRSWLEAVRLGPGTELAKKAQEGLQKVASILKSLSEIEKQ